MFLRNRGLVFKRTIWLILTILAALALGYVELSQNKDPVAQIREAASLSTPANLNTGGVVVDITNNVEPNAQTGDNP